MKVFVCGDETLAPTVGAKASAMDYRYFQVAAFLRFELAALFVAGQLDAVGFDPTSNLSSFFDGTAQSVMPDGAADAVMAPTASAIDIFAADLIIHLNGGLLRNPAMAAMIAGMHTQAIGAGVIWRDAGEVPTPAIFLDRIAAPKANASFTLTGRFMAYETDPSLGVSVNGGPFVPVLGAAIGNGQYSFPLLLATIGPVSIVVRDAGVPAVASPPLALTVAVAGL